VSIFGRTDPVRLAPYGQERFVVSRRDACATACKQYHASAGINRSQKCFAPPPACMAAITLADVAESVDRALDEG